MLWLYGLLFLLALLCWYRRRPGPAIPGPAGVPLLGNALQLSPESAHLQAAAWGARYGPLCQLRLGSHRVLVVSGPAALHEMLVLRGREFGGRSRFYRLGLNCGGYRTPGSAHFGPEQQALRKVMHGQLRQYGDGRRHIEAVTLDEGRRFVAALAERAGHEVDIGEELKDVIVNITYVMVLGERLEEEQEREVIKRVVDDHLVAIAPGGDGEWLDMFPWLRYLGNRTYRLLMRMDSDKRRLFETWKARGNPLGVVHSMLEDIKENNPLGFDELHVLATTWEMFFAGVSTSFASLASLLHVLSQELELQERLYEEGQRVAGGRVALRHKPGMHLHNATILELLRYTSAVPLGVPHLALADSELAGRPVPKGTLIWPNLWGLAHDAALWPEPFAFRPDRFLDEDGVLLGPEHPVRQLALPFSAGPRACPGEQFALSRLFLLTALLVQAFRLEAGAHQPSCDPRRMRAGLVLYPPPCKVICRLRE